LKGGEREKQAPLREQYTSRQEAALGLKERNKKKKEQKGKPKGTGKPKKSSSIRKMWDLVAFGGNGGKEKYKKGERGGPGK